MKSVLKQKSEMFQPGKMANDLQGERYKKQMTKLAKLAGSHQKTDSKFPPIKSPKRIEEEPSSQELSTTEEEEQKKRGGGSKKRGRGSIGSQDDIIRPLKKEKLFDMKEIATEIEVKLHYTYCKLEEKLAESKAKAERLRLDNSELIEKNKEKYYAVSNIGCLMFPIENPRVKAGARVPKRHSKSRWP